MKDNLYFRQILSLVFYLIFWVMRFNVDFNIHFPLLVIYIIPLIYYILYIDDLPIVNIDNIIFCMFSALYFIIIIVFFIPKIIGGNISPIIYQATLEEGFFRLCMLGICKKYLSFNSPISLWIVLLINSILFAFSHTVYNPVQTLTLIQLGIIYGLIYLSVGIGPTIISHSLWNLNHNIFFIYPILIPASGIVIYSLIKKISHNPVNFKLAFNNYFKLSK